VSGEAADDRGELVLVRHGETEWSRSARHTSATDLPLTDAGRERAARLAPILAGRDFALVLCSPLRRARETCELAGLGARASLCDELREWDYGEYEGLTTPQIRSRRPDWDLWRDGCPGGERPEQVAARADRVLERVRAAAGEAVAFAHGHILRVLAARWIELGPEGGARLRLGAGCYCVLGREHAYSALSVWNVSP
jgi:broad specificity phosphatase PhoE